MISLSFFINEIRTYGDYTSSLATFFYMIKYVGVGFLFSSSVFLWHISAQIRKSED